MTAAGHGKVHGGNHLEYNTFGYIIVSADERYLSIPFASQTTLSSILHPKQMTRLFQVGTYAYPAQV